MLININRPTDLTLTGVYIIENIINNKFYIGSTSESFLIRFKAHIGSLRRGTHKNTHLQNAYNKYGEGGFQFKILESCSKEHTLLREQAYLDKYISNKKCYNINPNATSLSKTEETLYKQSESRKKFYSECLPYYNKVKDKIINIEDVPKRFRSRIKSYLDNIPWNKGKKYLSTEHLKVPHSFTDRTNAKNTFRNKALPVYVYDINNNFIDCFRSAKDLEELSTTIILPIRSRFSTKRMNKEIAYLNSGNINKAIKLNKSYKGLYFYNKPLHLGIDDKNEPKSVEIWNDNAEVN